jgi:hypothetical protein
MNLFCGVSQRRGDELRKEGEKLKKKQARQERAARSGAAAGGAAAVAKQKRGKSGKKTVRSW